MSDTVTLILIGFAIVIGLVISRRIATLEQKLLRATPTTAPTAPTIRHFYSVEEYMDNYGT